MPKFRGAIFDVDGVLVDSPHQKAWRDSLRELLESDWRTPVAVGLAACGRVNLACNEGAAIRARRSHLAGFHGRGGLDNAAIPIRKRIFVSSAQ